LAKFSFLCYKDTREFHKAQRFCDIYFISLLKIYWCFFIGLNNVMNSVFSITQEKLKKNSYPEFRVGDVVRVHRRVKEGNKERVQIIEGTIIAHKHGNQPGATITVRRVTLGVAVELVLPLYSPHTEKIKVVKRQKTRQAKLYYLRKSKGKKSKLRENIEGTKRVKEQEEKRKAEKAKAAEEKKAEKAKEKAQKEKEEKLEEAPESDNIKVEKEKPEETAEKETETK